MQNYPKTNPTEEENVAGQRTHYEVLGVPRTASAEAIKSAYRRAARRTHPDHGGDADEFRLVSLAYETLADADARRAYDGATTGGRAAPARGTDGQGSSSRPASGASPRTSTTPSPGPQRSQPSPATGPAVYVPPLGDATAPLSRTVAEQRVHGAPRKRGLFSSAARLDREADTISLLEHQVLSVLPSARLINGLRVPGERDVVAHGLLAGHRLALIDSAMLPAGMYRWDGQRLFRDGRTAKHQDLALAVRRFQNEFMPVLNVTGFTVLYSPGGSLHEPVIDYGRGAEPSSPSATAHVVNPANLVRELKLFLGTGPDPSTVNQSVLARLLAGMY